MAHTPPLTATASEDLERLDSVLADAPVAAHTRATLLRRAALGAAAAAPAAGLLASSADASARGDSLAKIQAVAATAEALAVTYLTTVLERNERVRAFPKPVVEILRAADTAEHDHLLFLRRAGSRPLTLRFWIPDAAFGRGLRNVAATIEAAETLFVNAYLIHVTAAARAHRPALARYGAEILGVEAEHRALARELQGKLPNNVGFEQFIYTDIDAVVGALQAAGFGFGARGSKPGRFYHFRPPGEQRIDIASERPR